MSSTGGQPVVLGPFNGGIMHVMWAPCFVFAHLFVFGFLLRLISVAYPSTWTKIKQVVLCQGGRAHDGSTLTAEAVAAARQHSNKQGAKVITPATSGSKDVWSADQDDLEAGVNGNGELAHGSPSSAASEALIDKLTSRVHPMLLEWEEIGCSYKTPQGMRVVLQGIWGRAEPGDMVALMGPSGAGKSTLMDILAARKTTGHLSGQVLVNKHRRRKDHFRKRTAYVPQDDNFLPTMTVWETCNFYATLLLPNSTTKADRHERITEVLAAMGLLHTVDTLVGGKLPGGLPLRGLSGGERKRLSVAQGIMSTPSILFLDEPTSGLDAYAALSVMSYMRGMATAGSQTVVSSIHQPRAAIWALFDTTVLLSRGRMMYSGPREGMVPWFERAGYPYDPAMHGLASDWVMDLVNVGFSKPQSLFGKMMSSEDDLNKAADDYLQKYLVDNSITDMKSATAASKQQRGTALETVRDEEASESGHAITVISDGGADATALSRDQEDASTVATTAASVKASSRKDDNSGFNRPDSAGWFKQCWTLLWRELVSVTRNPADVAGRCIIFTYLAVFVGIIFCNLPTSVDGLRARLNVLFVEPVILLLLPYVYMSLFTSDKQYFIQDASAKLYRSSAYYVAKQLAVLPFAVLNSLLYTFILYGLVGFRHDPVSVGMNATMSVLMYLIAAQVLTFTATVMPNQDLAFMGAIAWTALNLLLDNFTMRFVDMNMQWFTYLRYLSAMAYSFDGYAQAEFQGASYSCSSGLAPSIVGFLPEFLPNTPIIRGPTAQQMLRNNNPDCVVNLDAILVYFDLHRPFWKTCVILLGYLGILHVATFGGLLLLAKKEKR